MWEIIHNIIFVSCHIILAIIGVTGLIIMSILIGENLNKQKF